MKSNANYLLKRSLAYFIDVSIVYLFVMLVIQMLILVPIRNYFGITEAWFRIGWNVQMYVLLTISIPVWLYFIISEASKHRATFGKRLMKLEVLNVNGNSRISISTSVKRTFFKLLPWELIHIGLNLPKPVWFQENPEFRYLTLFGSLLFVGYFTFLIYFNKNKTPYDSILGTEVKKNLSQ